MPAGVETITHWFVKIAGSDMPREMMDALISMEVDDSLDLPDMFTIHVRDPHLQWTESGPFVLGAPVEISVKTETSEARLMAGEVTGLEPTFLKDAGPTLLIRGYDLSHRLHHGRATKSFIQKTDGDMAKDIARAAGLRSHVDATTEVYDWVLQNNQTDLEFLQERARRIGYRIFVEEQTLHFVQAPPPPSQVPTLDWGMQLHDFRARLVTTEQVSEVVVRGWDPKRKKEIIGRARVAQGLPQISQATRGGQVAQQAFGNAGKQVVVDRPVATQAEADSLAQSLCNEIGNAFILAEGSGFGDPHVLAGSTVNLTGLGTKFSGQYAVTHSRHHYDPKGYTTHFSVTGQRGATLTQLLGVKPGGVVRPGVVVGVVTDNRDPEGWGRIKVKYPWQDDNIVSHWARQVTPMAGASRGFQFLPEVNDEVLLAFEHGDMTRPYVLGALWNGVDSPPENSSQVVSGQGKVNKRIIKSRAGHMVILDDTNDVGGITVVDKTGNNKITIDSQGNKITIEAQGDVQIKSSQSVNIEAPKISINGQATVDIKGGKINLN